MLSQQPGQSEQVRKWINTHTPELHLPLLSAAPRRRHTQEVLIQLASKAIERVFEPTTYSVACLHAPFPLVYWTCVPLFHVVGKRVTRSINWSITFRNAKKSKKSKKNFFFRAIFYIFGCFTCIIVHFRRVSNQLREQMSQHASSSIRYIWYISYIYYIIIYICICNEQPSALIKTNPCQLPTSELLIFSNSTCCKNKNQNQNPTPHPPLALSLFSRFFSPFLQTCLSFILPFTLPL